MHTVKEILLLLVDAEGAARKAAGKLLISILGKCGLKINSRSRGQTYDDGTNVKGECEAGQPQTLSLNNQARFVPCRVHNLNLLLCKAANLALHGPRRHGMMNRSNLPVTSFMKRWTGLKEIVSSYFQPFGHGNLGLLSQHSLLKADAEKN